MPHTGYDPNPPKKKKSNGLSLKNNELKKKKKKEHNELIKTAWRGDNEDVESSISLPYRLH